MSVSWGSLTVYGLSVFCPSALATPSGSTPTKLTSCKRRASANLHHLAPYHSPKRECLKSAWRFSQCQLNL